MNWNPNILGRLKFATKLFSSFVTPSSGQITVGAESTLGHIIQIDSTGKVIDLAAVTGQQDSVGFDPQYFWGFFSTAEGWTSSNANGTVAFDSSYGKGLLVTDASSSGSFTVRSPSGLAINGNKYRRIKASVTYVNLGGGIGAAIPNMQFSTSGHGFGAANRKLISWPPSLQAGDTIILDWDMETAEGEPDWVISTITQLSIGLTDTTPTGNIIRINWLAVGANRPPQGSDKRMRIIGLR